MPTTKPKQKIIKFFTVVGYSRIKGCIENNRYRDVFKTRKKAAQLVADEINEFIGDYQVEHRPLSAKDCENGYEIYAYNDADDKLDLEIVEHKVPADFFK